MGNFKVYTAFNKSLGQTAPSAWKCLKTQFWGPLTNWKFEPSPKAHPHSDLIINKHTEQVKKKVWIYHGMHWTLHYRQKLFITLRNKDLATRGFQKKFQKHPPKPAEAEPSFRKVNLPLTKLHILFPAHLWVREFWPQIYFLWQALAMDWGLLSNILASTKIGGT